MPVIREVVADIIAHPELYAEVFPVAELPVELMNSYDQPPTGSPAFHQWLRNVVYTDPIFPTDIGLPGSTATAGRLRHELLSTPFREDSLAARIARGDFHRTSQWGGMRGYYPLSSMVDEAGGAALTEQALDQVRTRIRPDHYRVSSGRCSCGFATMFQQDMADHLAGKIANDTDGVIKRLMVCARCGESRPCRRVAIAYPGRLGFHTSTDFNPAELPSVSEEWRCGRCVN